MIRKSKDSESVDRPIRQASNPKAQEDQMISLAMDLAAKQLRAGTASSQTITHFLKLGTTREQLEKVKLENETALIIARVDDIASKAHSEELYEKAMKAFSKYRGEEEPEEERYED